MSTLELGFIIFVGAVVLFGSAVSLHVLSRAYFGGRDRLQRPPKAKSRSGDGA